MECTNSGWPLILSRWDRFQIRVSLNLISFNIYQSDGLTLVLIGLKIEVIFASTKILYCDVICISTSSKVGKNPAFIKGRINDFFVEINDKK